MWQLPLNKRNSKKSTNVNETLSIELSGSKRLLPLEPFDANISESEQYYLERSESTKLRLVCHINTICSNILHNPITEIVKNEGSDSVEWFRDGEPQSATLQGRPRITRQEALDDTQLTNSSNGYTYHCGLDILTNHIIRNRAFKTINNIKSPSESFNTITDYLRQYNGEDVKGYNAITSDNAKPLHVYLNEEILTFKQSVEVNREVENGWVGFYNRGNFQTLGSNSLGLNYHNVINNRKPCDFIDFYPERDLFYFTPKYNSKRRRIEKNWNYYITYPCSSTTDINFIRKGTNSLKVMLFDETSRGYDGLSTIRITSVSKHGLQEGHFINVYNGDEVFSYNARVTSIIDDYTFTCYKQGGMLSSKWVDLSDSDIFKDSTTINVDGKEYHMGNGKYYTNEGKRYYVTNNNMLNIDDDAQDISFKRVINGEECEYYVRIFAKLPNWKLAPKKPNYYDLYKDENANKYDLITKYQKTEYDFQNSLGALAFSRNVYNDDIAEIVFTDDIDFDALKDNLGRPLSELFLTVVKNNRGYEEWYGINGQAQNINSDTIEYSHCFGKNTCAFHLSDETLNHETYNSVIKINNIQNATAYNGLNVDRIQFKDDIKTEFDRSGLDVDEIEPNPNRAKSNATEDYCGDRYFYGDLCCYHKSLCNEVSIQMVDFRFNTVQRESNNASLLNIIAKEITYDDFDIMASLGTSSTTYGVSVLQKPEGYYYKPHYRIPLRTFADEVRQMRSQMLTLKKIEIAEDGKYTLTILENNIVGLHTEIKVYDMNNDEFYYGEVLNFHNSRKFECLFRKLNGDLVENLTNDTSQFLYLIQPSDVPNYAIMSKDGSCIWYWRDIIQNGFDDNADASEVYPFTNGALYAKLDVMLFVRRQDPKQIANAYSNSFLNDLEPSVTPQIQEDNYVSEEDIKC